LEGSQVIPAASSQGLGTILTYNLGPLASVDASPSLRSREGEMSSAGRADGGRRDSVVATLAWGAIGLWIASSIWLLVATLTHTRLYALRLGPFLGGLPLQWLIMVFCAMLSGWASVWLVRRYARRARQQPTDGVPVSQRRRMKLDIASWIVVPFSAGLCVWLYIYGALVYGHNRAPRPFVNTSIVWVATLPFVAFGIIWLALRVSNRRMAWWRPLVTAHPVQAYAICALGPASLFFGYRAGGWLLMFFNYLYS